MTEDIKPEVIKKTQDVLGKYIKKPALTEKLLKKPPFRFLHDICTAAMRETGFFEGVLNSVDSKAENIKDKEAKIAFLLKVIGAVEAANGVKLSVKPSKVVAGHEPTKTNEFLQALGKALEKQQVENGNSTKAGQQPKTKTKTTTKRPIKEEPPGKKKSTSTKPKTQKPVENGTDDSAAKPKIKPQPDENSPSPIKNSHKKSEKISPTEEDSVTLENSTAKPKTGQNGIIEENGDRAKHDGRMKSSKNRRSFEGGDSIDIQNDEGPQISGMNGQGDQNEDSKTPYNHEEVKRPNSARPGHRKPSAQQIVDRAKPSEPIINGHDEPDKLERQDSTLDKVLGDKIDSINRSESVLGDRVKITPSPPEMPSHRFPKKEGSASKERAIPSQPPRSAIRPTTSRPASARPAAPRIRDRGEVAIQEEVIKPASGQVKVIIEKDLANDHDEDENLVSLEVTNEILSEPVPEPSRIGNASSEQTEHGHLVEQILETQKELEGPFSEKKTGKTEIEWESGRNRESTYREVERLRASIQTLTRSANPLGKLLDFLQEDIDTMQRELETWKEMNSNLSVQIHQEKSLTEQSIEPLKIHLKELQQSIDVQLEQISIVKANIIRNDQKINKLLTGI